MYKTTTFLLAATICCYTSLAQKKQPDTVRKYLNLDLALTNKANGELPALSVKTGDHWLLMSVYPDTSVLLKAYFQDEKLTIKDGPFVLYHPKKLKAAEGLYENNIKQGPWMFWHPNGKLRDSGVYKNNHYTGEWRRWNDSGQLVSITHYPAPEDIRTVISGTGGRFDKRPSILAGDTSVSIMQGTAMSFYPNGQLQDSGAYIQNLKEGVWKNWYKNGNLESMGSYVHSIQEGEWEYFRENGTRSSREKYVKSKVTALECFDEQGNFYGNTCAIQKPPVPQGKFLDFDKYALDNMFWPEELKRADIEGTVHLEYTITKEGKLTNLKILATPHKLMADEVIRFFNSIGQWSPAISHNRPIDYTVRYQVPFYR